MVKDSNMTQLIEKRRHERKPTQVEVEVVTGGVLNKKTAVDISVSGIYVKNCDIDSYKVGENIVLAFESRSGDPHLIEGTIVRKDKEGMGIQFSEELLPKVVRQAQEWL